MVLGQWQRILMAELDGPRLIAVGPTGEDTTDDYGIHWKSADSVNLNALAILDRQHGWAAGPLGTIVRLRHP